MAANNNLEQESFASTGGKEVMVLSSSSSNDDHQPMMRPWRGSPKIVYDAKPISWYRPDQQEVCGTVEETSGQWGGGEINYDALPISCVPPPKEEVPGNRSRRERKRSEFVGRIEKDFTLLEVFQSNNLQEIIQNRETAECTLDSQQILEKLKGWTVVSHRRQENSKQKSRVDKVYRHPSSKTLLRSVRQIENFIVSTSFIKKSEEGGSREEEAVAAEGGCGSQSVEESPTTNNIYVDVFQRLRDIINHGGGTTDFN